MDNFMDRLYNERRELEEKYNKLSKFLKNNAIEECVVEREQYLLMQKQKLIMGEYLDVLNKRIYKLKEEKNDQSKED